MEKVIATFKYTIIRIYRTDIVQRISAVWIVGCPSLAE